MLAKLGEIGGKFEVERGVGENNNKYNDNHSKNKGSFALAQDWLEARLSQPFRWAQPQ